MITSKPTNEESILVAFSKREEKLAALRLAGKISPAVWIVIGGAWFAAVWALHLGEIRFPELMIATVLLFALGSCFHDYNTRLRILSDHLIEDTHTKPLVGSGHVNSVNSVQKS